MSTLGISRNAGFMSKRSKHKRFLQLKTLEQNYKLNAGLPSPSSRRKKKLTLLYINQLRNIFIHITIDFLHACQSHTAAFNNGRIKRAFLSTLSNTELCERDKLFRIVYSNSGICARLVKFTVCNWRHIKKFRCMFPHAPQ